VAAPAMAAPFPYIPQQPLRFGLGLIALTFYLWLIHSYKLAAGDIAVIGLALGVLVRGSNIRFPLPLVFFGLFILWGCLGLGVTENLQRTSDALVSLGKLWIIAFCVLNVVRNAAEFRFVVIAWLALFAVYPVRGALYNQYICQCTTFNRVAWNFVFSNPNDLAALAMLPLGLSAGVATVERVKFFRLSALAGVLILALIVMLTQSRGAILALGAAAVLLALTSRHKGRDAILLLLLVGGAAVFAPKAVWERVAGLSNVSVEEGMQGVDQEGSAEARWQIWVIAARTIRENPVLGVGAAMMPVRHRWESGRLNLPDTMRGERDTHSTYLRIAAELGVPALILYVLMWASVFWRVRQVRRSIAHVRPKDHQFLFFLELAMLAYMVASLFGSYGALSFTYLIIAVAWLAAEILERETWYVSPRTVMKLQAQAAGVRTR
jgi:O-antigen ligase